MIPENGRRKTFKRWVVEEVWGWRCQHGHARVVDYEQMVINSKPPTTCLQCNHEYYLLRFNALDNGLIPHGHRTKKSKRS